MPSDDVVMAWSVDRLGRSLQDLIAFLSELHALKVDLFLKTQGIDTTTPGGKAMFQMMGVPVRIGDRLLVGHPTRRVLPRLQVQRVALADVSAESAYFLERLPVCEFPIYLPVAPRALRARHLDRTLQGFAVDFPHLPTSI
jgi:hypothetical protein